MNPNKYRLIFSVISLATADPDYPVGIYAGGSLCGPGFIVFVQQVRCSAGVLFYGGRADERFPSTTLR